MFGAFLVVWTSKGVLEGLGGSGGSAYMAQRYYAARSDVECQKIAMLWTVLFAFRWPMVLGFAVLGVKLGIDASLPGEAERLLPQVLKSDYFPTGIRGLMLAAMLAAAMSTFDSTVNAGASYLVRDIYEPWRGATSPRERVWAGYAASILIVAVGLIIALLAAASVIGVWVNIVMLLFPAFLVPFALRWYWSRFNGAGFALGIIAGFAASLGFFLVQPAGWNEAMQFVAIALISAAVAVGGALATTPVANPTLRAFYNQVRPMGWWPRSWTAPDRVEHRGDQVRLGVALGWQVLTFLIPMGLVLGLWTSVLPAFALWTGLFLYLLRDLRRSERAEADNVNH
jgi:Na+/proline symporter